MPMLDFPMEKIREGSAEIFVSSQKRISKKLPVFYNPSMKLNRDVTVLMLREFPPMNICDPLAGTGIRAIRFAKELKYSSIIANDLSKIAVVLLRKNMKHNKVSFEVHNQDANIMLLESTGFDFIDLDVFGSPNFVLDTAIKRLSRIGILAVTATDTACLSGTIPKACMRKYWAKPFKNEIMHEIGLRILIRKVQLIGAQYDKALVPIFSYAKEHYMRIFMRCTKGKQYVDAILTKHGMLHEAGPLWLGPLWDKALAAKMYKNATENKKFLEIIKDEAAIPVIGFYDIHKLVKHYKIKGIPKKELLLVRIKELGYKAAETHFNPEAIRSEIPQKELVKLVRKIIQ